MKKWILLIGLFCSLHAVAQFDMTNLQSQLFYYNPKGLTFIPPFAKPGLVYNGKLYIGKKKLNVLFKELNDIQLYYYYDRYKANKVAGDIFSFVGSVALPITNIFVSANNGKINWWLLGAGMITGGTGAFLKAKAQQHLLMAALYYDSKMKAQQQQPNSYVPQQTTIGIAIPF